MSEFWQSSGNRNTDAAQQQIQVLQAALEGPLPLRTLSVAQSAVVDANARCVRYVGSTASDVLTLPTANALGAGVGQAIVLVNTSAVAISVVPSGSDTLNGVTTAYSLAARSQVLFVADAQGAWWAAPVPDTTGRLLRLTVLTGTTLAVFPGTLAYRLRLWGGGGGGGGVISAACAAAGGGGAGSYAERYGNPIAASYTFALGAAGAAGSTAGGDGGNGGDSTFSAGGVTVTAPGGKGGKGDAAGTAGATSRARGGGAGGAVASNGNVINGGGAPGHPSVMVRINFADIMATSGAGGSSALGGGGGVGRERSVTSTSNGADAIGPASGGGGAIDDGTAARTGGTGGAGYGILEEFS